MNELLDRLSKCIEHGKVNKSAPFPPNMKDQPGADELTKEALQNKISPEDILNLALFPGMERIGIKFKENKVFVPEVLMAAKAMSTAMVHLNPFFQQGVVKQKGVLVIGTVAGDMHDIGKNLVSMIVEGSGWKIIDLGTNVTTDKFIEVAGEYPDCYIGLSALLTTTMVNMESTTKVLKEKFPNIKILIGGAPVTEEFMKKIGADFYSSDPQGAIEYLNQ